MYRSCCVNEMVMTDDSGWLSVADDGHTGPLYRRSGAVCLIQDQCRYGRHGLAQHVNCAHVVGVFGGGGGGGGGGKGGRGGSQPNKI